MLDQILKQALIICEDPSDANAFKNILEKNKLGCKIAKNAEDSIYLYNTTLFDFVCIDDRLNTIPGHVIVQKFQNHEKEVKRNPLFAIYKGSNSPIKTMANYTEQGVELIISRPINPSIVAASIIKAYKAHKDRLVINTLRYNVIEPLAEKGDIDKAIAKLKSEAVPTGEYGEYVAASMMIDFEKLDDSMQIVDGRLQKEPDNLAFQNIAGRIHMLKGNIKDAEMVFMKLDQIAPDNIERLGLMTDMYLDNEQGEKAVEKAKRLVELHPEKRDEMLFDMVEKFAEKGFEQEAKDLCHSIATDREIVRYYNNKGAVLSKQQNYHAAIKEYSKAMTYARTQKYIPQIMFNIGIAYLGEDPKNNRHKALQYFEKCVELKPDYDKAKAMLEKLKTPKKAAG